MSASHRSERSSSGGTGEPGWDAIPFGVALTRPALAATASESPSAVTGTSSTSVVPPLSETVRALARDWSGSTTSSRRTPECGEGVRDRGAGATGSEQHDPVAVDPRQPVGEGPLEAGHVGVVPDRSPVADQDRVERPDRRHVRRHLVDQGHHGLLGRVGDVEPVEAQLDRSAQQALQALGVDRDVRLVDDLVDVPQPLPLRLPLVQLRGQRRTDAVADQPRQPRPSRRRRGHSPSLSGR